MKRDLSLDAMRNRKEPFDILIVGGGATGLGTAFDAIVRGYSVALIEQDDFAKGTSSRSTKLVHGGVRYLKQGNVSLVREALRERGRLMKNAPHLVRELGFVVPIYRWFDGPFYGIGMKVYDALAGKLGMGKSSWLNREETIEALPTVAQKGLRGGVRYFDGQFDDARLVMSLARSAARRGACLANYVRCESLVKEDGKVVGVQARDCENGEEFTVRARVVVNATGIFADELRTNDEASSKEMVTVSQGVHLVLPREFLPGEHALMVPKTEDGRVLFAVPWKDVVLVGTTDTPREEPLLEPRPLAEELEFILSHTEKHLGRRPKPEEVRSVYAGLRPLVKKPGSGGDTSKLSRSHVILVSESGLLTVTGGKWTTYRQMAEDVVDRIGTLEGWEERPCGTTDLMLDAGEEGFEVKRFVREEMARTVEDVLARRTRRLVIDAQAARDSAEEVARAMAEELGRDEQWIAEQVKDFHQLAKNWLLE